MTGDRCSPVTTTTDVQLAVCSVAGVGGCVMRWKPRNCAWSLRSAAPRSKTPEGVIGGVDRTCRDLAWSDPTDGDRRHIHSERSLDLWRRIHCEPGSARNGRTDRCLRAFRLPPVPSRSLLCVSWKAASLSYHEGDVK
jgi:hypothetical protein